MMPDVHVVVVAYNRRELLSASLAAIKSQTAAIAAVHVVDNGSTDGTDEMVATQFPKVQLHALRQNTGGAGGFAAGLFLSLSQNADLVWLMDDDSVPNPTALAELLQVRDSYAGPLPALLASKVVWSDGRDHPMNTPRQKPGASAGERAAARAVGCLPIRSASFVSVLVSADAVRAVGLPEADYFVWNDDFEFTTRLLRNRRGLFCPNSVVEHRTKTFGATDADPGERFYYEVRNKVWTFTRSDGLSAPERILYSGSTLARWVRTFAKSDNRSQLRTGLRRGLVDGFTTRPRDVHAVLGDAGIESADITLRKPSSA